MAVTPATASADSPMAAIGQRARDARIDLRDVLGRVPSQGEMADALGWSQQKYSKMERGDQERLSINDLQSLAVQLRVDEYWLFTGRHPQPVSDLAMQIDRLKLDHWGEAAVLETARREAKRYAEQEAQRNSVEENVKRLVAAGFGEQEAIRAARAMLGIETPPPAVDEGRAAEGFR